MKPHLSAETNLFKAAERMFRYWWAMLASGLLLAGLGIWIIRSPFRSYTALGWLIAVGMTGTGILDIVFAWINRRRRRWLWHLLAGVADILIGTYLFNNRLFTIIFLPLATGLWTFYKGCMAFGDVLHVRRYAPGNWRRLLLMAITVLIMASLLLLCPVIGIENIFLFSGLSLLGFGLFRVYLSFKVRSLKGQ